MLILVKKLSRSGIVSSGNVSVIVSEVVNKEAFLLGDGRNQISREGGRPCRIRRL